MGWHVHSNYIPSDGFPMQFLVPSFNWIRIEMHSTQAIASPTEQCRGDYMYFWRNFSIYMYNDKQPPASILKDKLYSFRNNSFPIIPGNAARYPVGTRSPQWMNVTPLCTQGPFWKLGFICPYMAGAIYKVYWIISLPAENIRIYLSDQLETKIKYPFTFSEGGVPDVYK